MKQVRHYLPKSPCFPLRGIIFVDHLGGCASPTRSAKNLGGFYRRTWWSYTHCSIYIWSIYLHLGSCLQVSGLISYCKCVPYSQHGTHGVQPNAHCLSASGVTYPTHSKLFDEKKWWWLMECNNNISPSTASKKMLHEYAILEFILQIINKLPVVFYGSCTFHRQESSGILFPPNQSKNAWEFNWWSWRPRHLVDGLTHKATSTGHQHHGGTLCFAIASHRGLGTKTTQLGLTPELRIDVDLNLPFSMFLNKTKRGPLSW